MKKTILTAGFLFYLVFNLSAQSGVPDPDSVKDPVKQGDPATQVVPAPNAEYQSLVKIKPSQVPDAIKTKLEHPAYEGWQKKATIYRNQASTVYLIVFNENGTVRKYRYYKNGQQLVPDEL